MKKLISIVVTALLVISFVSCQSKRVNDEAKERKDAYTSEIFGSYINDETNVVGEIPTTIHVTESSSESTIETDEVVTSDQASEEITSSEKSIYDYPFDIDAIKQELILIGESTGMTHIIYDDGILRTPDNSSWSGYYTASENFQDYMLERNLKDSVSGIRQMFKDYGWTDIEYFTIYVEDLNNGSFRFYVLY